MAAAVGRVFSERVSIQRRWKQLKLPRIADAFTALHAPHMPWYPTIIAVRSVSVCLCVRARVLHVEVSVRVCVFAFLRSFGCVHIRACV